MVLTSVSPSYDDPQDQISGITLPGKLKRWFQKSGFSVTEAHTSKFFNQGMNSLLLAQTDYRLGHSICMFVDAGVFAPFKGKRRETVFPNHWVVLNSDIQVIEYDENAKKYKPAAVISKEIIDRISAKTKDEREMTRMKLDVFSWGNLHQPAISIVSADQAPSLDYFLRGFNGYLKVKR